MKKVGEYNGMEIWTHPSVPRGVIYVMDEDALKIDQNIEKTKKKTLSEKMWAWSIPIILVCLMILWLLFWVDYFLR